MAALDGIRIAVVDADGPLGAPAVAAFTAAGAAVAPVPVDATGDAMDGVDRAVAQLGGIDVLANLTKPSGATIAAVDITHDDWEAVFKAHVRTARTSNQAAFRHMTEAGSGHVINYADIAAENGAPGEALAATAAQAVVAWTRAAGGAWLFQGVRTNIFQPGMMANLERQVIPTLVFLAAGVAPVHGVTISC
jgi:NAD(P)-dependent dehydrogenase (short-subunit alcohol dehydrogenase family)